MKEINVSVKGTFTLHFIKVQQLQSFRYRKESYIVYIKKYSITTENIITNCIFIHS